MTRKRQNKINETPNNEFSHLYHVIMELFQQWHIIFQIIFAWVIKKLHEWLRCLTYSTHQSCQSYCMCKNLKFAISSDKSGPCINLQHSAHLHRHLFLGQAFLQLHTHIKRSTTANETYNKKKKVKLCLFYLSY